MTIGQLPPSFTETRDALHQVAFFALAPARYRAVGRMGLEATPGGFGTPQFEDRIARVQGDQLVHEENGNIATQLITTLREAATFFGGEYEVEWFSDFHDPLQPMDPDTPLSVDREASLALGQWFRFGFDVLNELRGHGVAGDDVSPVQLWPEHFDPATELGNSEKGQRASFGASPGDGSHDEPYLYVAPWSEVDRSNSYWNDPTFGGASIGHAELLASDDPHSEGLEFLLEGHRILHAG